MTCPGAGGDRADERFLDRNQSFPSKHAVCSWMRFSENVVRQFHRSVSRWVRSSSLGSHRLLASMSPGAAKQTPTRRPHFCSFFARHTIVGKRPSCTPRNCYSIILKSWLVAVLLLLKLRPHACTLAPSQRPRSHQSTPSCILINQARVYRG